MYETERTLTDQRYRIGRGRHGVGDEQHEHGEGQKHRQSEPDLLARPARQAEPEQRQRAEHDARRDHVERVVERPTPHRHAVRQFRVDAGIVAVPPPTAVGHLHANQVPLAVVNVHRPRHQRTLNSIQRVGLYRMGGGWRHSTERRCEFSGVTSNSPPCRKHHTGPRPGDVFCKTCVCCFSYCVFVICIF